MAANTHNDPLLDLLMEAGALTDAQVEEVLEEQRRAGKPIRKVVLDMGILTEDDLLVLIANHMGVTMVNIADIEIPPEISGSVPAGVARMYNMAPVSYDSVTLATSELVQPETMDEIRFVLTRDV